MKTEFLLGIGPCRAVILSQLNKTKRLKHANGCLHLIHITRTDKKKRWSSYSVQTEKGETIISSNYFGEAFVELADGLGLNMGSVGQAILAQRALYMGSLPIPKNASWSVGEGHKISFWHDNWTRLAPLVAFCHRGAACFPSLG